jgi:hypothetical protein
VGVVSDTEDALNLLKEPLGVLHWLTTPEAWIRIGKVVGGVGLALGGAYMLMRVQVLEPVGKKVAGVAVSVLAPEAKGAATAAKGAQAAKSGAGSVNNARGAAGAASTPNGSGTGTAKVTT